MNRNKKGLQTEGPLYKNSQREIYYSLSGWIANLGVVPLLLFSAFLFCPIFFLRFALLFLVILVFETILKLLNICNHLLNAFSSRSFVHSCGQCVKAFLLLGPLLSPLAHSSYENDIVILSRSSHKEFIIPNMTRFSIGNKEVVAHKFFPEGKKLVIKGRKLGHTEVAIWGRESKEGLRTSRPRIIKKLQVYVLSKKKHLDTLHILQTIKEHQLKAQISGNMIIVSGQVTSMESYLLISTLIKKYKKSLVLRLSIQKKLRNEIIGKVYKEFFDRSLTYIKCSKNEVPILCHIPVLDKSFDPFIKSLKQRLGINFLSTPIKAKKKSYRVSLKILLMERVGVESISIGLDQLTANMKELFSIGLNSLINRNLFTLKNQNIQLSMLAEPRSIVQMGKEMMVQVGQELPFQKDEGTLSWKFAGLKVKLSLKDFYRDFQVSYSTELTTPTKGNTGITGNKESSTMVAKKGEAITLFEIGLKTKKNEDSKTPILSAIPLLGNLLKGNQNHDSFKKITGVLLIEDI